MIGKRITNKLNKLHGTIIKQEPNNMVIVQYDSCKLERKVSLDELKIKP